MGNNVLYNVLLVLAVIIAIVFIAMIMITSKGDAMQGGGQIRTTFKGRATVEDQIAKLNVGLAVAFVALMLIIDVVSKNLGR